MRRGEAVVDVLAAGLHPRVRSQADGSHYTSTGELPLVPGIDGVVRDRKGRMRLMSSWVALRRRIEFRRGQRVLVLGATGNAGGSMSGN